jgi:beta-phosphoglucomutase-like phosphatase (HAD superfamily)
LWPELFLQMGPTRWLSFDTIYNKITQLGIIIPRERLLKEVSDQAHNIYNDSTLTPGIDSIGPKLIEMGYKIWVVSASPIERINLSLVRTDLKNHISHIISLQDRSDLAHKPAPDGYLEMMHQLDSDPQSTIILEDSNTWIQSGKASWAFVIGFRQYLNKEQIIGWADDYADNLDEVVSLVNLYEKPSN